MNSDQNPPEAENSELSDLLAETERAVAQSLDPIFDEEAGWQQIRGRVAELNTPAKNLPAPTSTPAQDQQGRRRASPGRYSAVPTRGGVYVDGALAMQPDQVAAAQANATSDARLVRPTARTGGRTRPRNQLALEALVSTTAEPERLRGLLPEYQGICHLCREIKSIAEVSALLSIPLGTARILVADLAEGGLVAVQQPSNGVPDVTLLERVLSGLRKL